MILSSTPVFAGYDRWLRLIEQGRYPTVSLDGAQLTNVLAANDKSGRAVVVARLADGRIMLDSRGQPLGMILEGIVKIEIPQHPNGEPDGFD